VASQSLSPTDLDELVANESTGAPSTTREPNHDHQAIGGIPIGDDDACLLPHPSSDTYRDLATFKKLLVLTVMYHCTQLLQLLLLPDSLMR